MGHIHSIRQLDTPKFDRRHHLPVTSLCNTLVPRLWDHDDMIGGRLGGRQEGGGIDARSRCADDLRESGYETKTVVNQVKSWRSLVQVSKFGQCTGNSQLTSKRSAATSSASAATLTTPRILSTSNQGKNFFSRKQRRAEVIPVEWAMCSSTPVRCSCHDLHAYRKAWSMYRPARSCKSPISELMMSGS